VSWEEKAQSKNVRMKERKERLGSKRKTRTKKDRRERCVWCGVGECKVSVVDSALRGYGRGGSNLQMRGSRAGRRRRSRGLGEREGRKKGMVVGDGQRGDELEWITATWPWPSQK
jgi:hypothetical protein